MSCVEPIDRSLSSSSSQAGRVYRVDVLPKTLELLEKTELLGVGCLRSYPVYWFYALETLSETVLEKIAATLLVDSVYQRAIISHQEQPARRELLGAEAQWVIEKRFLPGVTDNLGKTVEKSLGLLLSQSQPCIQVASGLVYYLMDSSVSQDELEKSLSYRLYNPLVESIRIYVASQEIYSPCCYHFPLVSNVETPQPEVIALDVLDDDLFAISQQRNLALTLEEMKVIQTHYQTQAIQQHRQSKGLPLWPTDVELEIFAQTWSEHCKHKIFAAKIRYTEVLTPEYSETIEIDGLFKTYIAGATKKLMAQRPDLLSVFKDNAGVMQWNDQWAVCFKVETHNSPSALEPYGGALTGIVGVNRDILGTGLGAKPLFNTDVFCFAHPDGVYVTRPKMLPPEAILQGVRKGVEDGGNKSGIPTVNGSLFFDARYRAKPLVFCGTGGLMPIEIEGTDYLGHEKYTTPGDTIVMAGGRVGKDGIHGATFSSESLHEGSPVSAVQIGDPLTQKRMMDFLMAARDCGLLTGMTDNGAGGLSSSVGEMATQTNGATLHLESVPLKYPGLSPYEIMISESQERMTLSTRNFEALSDLATRYDVEVSAIGAFHDKGTFDIYHQGTLVASLDLDFLHNGLPQMQLEARWELTRSRSILSKAPRRANKVLLKLLAHPNICSREALIRQYDHEVQGKSVIKPLMGHLQIAPCDAAVIQPLFDEQQGLVISNGLCPQYADWDAYAMAACAVDEAVRNAVAVGADPASLAILDNFCWPDPLPSKRNPDAVYKLGQLVRANQALYDVSLAYGVPLISGKDSMKNDFDDGTFRLSIPPTLLVSAIGKIPDIHNAVSMEFKAAGDQIFLLGKTNVHMGASHYYDVMGWYGAYCPRVDTALARMLYSRLFTCIQKGWIRSAHDLSEGGLGVALAESVLSSAFGASVSLEPVMNDSPELRWDEALFSESPSRFVLSVSPQYADAVKQMFEGLPLLPLGEVTERPRLEIRRDDTHAAVVDMDVDKLRKAWHRAPAKAYEGAMTP